MFSNIGGKIKKLAKILCWVGIILSVILGILAIAAGNNLRLNYNGSNYYAGAEGANVITGILIIVLGSLFSWIGSFFTYGFGQLIENSDEIRKNTAR